MHLLFTFYFICITIQIYGDKDNTLTTAERTAIDAWESKRAKSKLEFAYAVDEFGNTIGEKRGGKGSVKAGMLHFNPSTSTFTHIHPRGDGELGGTFSDANLRNFASFGQRTVRAVAKEGVYSMSKGTNFDTAGFKSMVSNVKNTTRSAYRSKEKVIILNFN